MRPRMEPSARVSVIRTRRAPEDLDDVDEEDDEEVDGDKE